MKMDKAKIDEFIRSADMRSDQEHNMQSFMDDTFGADAAVAPTMFSFLKRIAAQTQLIHLNYSPEEEKLVLIGTQSQVNDAQMLVEFLWRLQQKNKAKEQDIKGLVTVISIF